MIAIALVRNLKILYLKCLLSLLIEIEREGEDLLDLGLTTEQIHAERIRVLQGIGFMGSRALLRMQKVTPGDCRGTNQQGLVHELRAVLRMENNVRMNSVVPIENAELRESLGK